MMTRRRLVVLATLLGILWIAPPGAAWAGCPEILGFLAGKAVDVVCFDSPDLTTNNVTTSADPLGCRLNPASTTFVHFYINDPEKSFTEWAGAIIEEAPDLFDGSVDWEGTFVDPVGPNLLIDLAPALKNFPAYVASGFNPNSPAAQAIRAAGYPPDILNGPLSL